MDNYVILDAMCLGSFGITLFVKDRVSGLEHTLKKIECLDEGRANQALQEISSVILSMVMDCPFTTTLSTVITSQREENKKFKIKVIKVFLGQMVDAFAYLHKRNIVHRNLKPSNILMTKGPIFRICDFGTSTITGDRVKLQKKVKECAKRWMAPESVTEQQWSEKSDIWSLGCVLLEMLTCHMFDVETSLSQLLRIKQDLSPLDIIMSQDLLQLLGMMFSRKPKNRASVWELVNEDMVKQSLMLCGSSLHAMKKTLPPGVTGPPFHKGFDSVFEFMLTYRDIESVQSSILSYLMAEEKDVLYRVTDVVEAVISAMQSHRDCANVQLKSCQVLQQRLLAVQGKEESACLYTKAAIACVLKAVRGHPEQADLLCHAFQFLFLILENEGAARLIADLDGIQDMVKTLKAFPENRDVIVPCCKCLWSTLAQKHHTAVESVRGAVEAVCLVGGANLPDRAVMESVCAALQSLILQGISEEKGIEDSTLVLMHALGAHPNHRNVVNYAFLALTSLVSSEVAAFRLLLARNGGSGIALIKEAKLQHRGDPEVTKNFCSLLNEMAQHNNVVPELVAENVQKELKLIKTEFASNKEIILLVQHALSRLKSR